MVLSRKQFDVLVAFSQAKNALTQREIEASVRGGASLGTINKVIRELSENGLVKDGSITPLGLNELEPYRARRAIFIAAGFGARLVPVTLNTPKPLVRVNGKRIIDTLIDACLDAGISEIYIVRGYLSEQFDQLLYKYPMIKFLENPSYNDANNISSAMTARFLMQNAYIFEADLLLSNPKLIRRYNYCSNVLGIWKERTDDWCFTCDKDNYVTGEKVGGLNCYQMIGIYYMDALDGAKLSEHIKEAYQAPGGKERYWETVPNEVYKGQYRIEIIPCKEDDVVEIDTFKELKAIDRAYDV